MLKRTLILGIESSCDDTSIAVIDNYKILANIVSSQDIHKKYGGVVPEIASREHMKNIVPVLEACLSEACVSKKELSAIAFTNGPGLMGALIVGSMFAQSLAYGLNIPAIPVHHMQGHILSHFIENNQGKYPTFPFLCLTVSGGHTQIMLVEDYFKMEVIGTTLDDAAGEAFDKTAKMLGLNYPGGPEIDKLSNRGDGLKFKFAKPNIQGLNFSFSGLKTSVLYFLQKQSSSFILENIHDLAASIQYTIIDILIEKINLAIRQTGIKRIALAGGVAANSELRNRMLNFSEQKDIEIFLPPKSFCTDNAAMIAVVGSIKYQKEVQKTRSFYTPQPRLALF